MGGPEPHWSKRRKRRVRRVAYDVRLFAPLAALALCVVGSATAILAVEHTAPIPHAASLPEVSAPAASDDCRPATDLARSLR